MNLKVATGLLEPLQMKMHTAENGKQAIAMMEQKKYDLVFMDHMMPIMDGIEATIAIRAMDDEYYKNVPIIAHGTRCKHVIRNIAIPDNVNNLKSNDNCFSVTQRATPEITLQTASRTGCNIIAPQNPTTDAVAISG